MTERGAEISELWKRTQDALAAADTLPAEGFADFAASRAYYAAFYAASALLLSDGRKFSKHRAVIAPVHKDYVKEGRLSPEVGRIISSLYDLRGVGDYGGTAHVTPEKAGDALEKARASANAVAPLLLPGAR